MAKHIVELTDALSNKIAAGEVVERPASVVKELVENAIDAGSTVIDILVEEAGLNKITIIDNGSGIEEEDVATAFLRHATSKIKNEADLFRVHTLGFRGEALPSIASVSHLAMETSTGETKGTSISLEGGKIIEQKSGHARKGTQIEVSQLFFNTPARLKYLKSLPTELGNITDILNRLALAHPDISFRFSHNGKPLLQTNGNGDLRQVIAAIYGISIAKKSIPVKAESLDFKISGYAVLPEVNRSNRNYISTIINGRFIKNFALVKAIQEGYHTLLPIGRFPIIVLQIEMDPIIVDVNVHPAKLEVRLSKEKELGQLISQMIKEAFHKLQLIPDGEISKKQKEVQKSEQIQMSFEENKPAKEIPTLFSKPTIPEYVPSDEDAPREDDFILETMPPYEPQAEQEEHSKERIPKMYPIGQMHATYIFAQNENGLYIIDQHAAQERIKYEFYREKIGEVSRELQELLVPIVLEFPADEYVRLEEQKAKLEEVGVFLENFGQNSFIIRAHPTWFPKDQEEEMLREIIDEALSAPSISIHKLREDAAIMMSCKKSIKANHYLTTQDMEALLDTLREASDPFTCPHGRPVIIQYSTYELEKMFKRVM
ncbi:DNA mismatch repair endonuclease MutL [Listeria monocytogenes]|uniref:DNA mismatch repair protein MutL n=3 Tax=Listeria monocytogenes TaxID=1639 RepID=A0A9P1SWJ3_LISMN|nr:DNA mismatch repair endonuclease MutL [Listeria monocytogenes]EAD5038036.1 DNA mismatch repair endonuclease MutL [Listeria monocytogenes serotype 1/2a]EAE6021036.1 DNA mismatch repair endonuclease MutL [Listeria monocytogenes serotype 3a]EAG6282286.1 DNA mismatch repair endonuclease MutL [Listeria monocytogenes CFSAN003810]EAH4128478.1 DNA mismatch repair endonuclease MutL [Listeria monocytogenes LIS0077]MCY49752.1 DNA mismatch repair protein MutL [Listeria monocytogenes serotype 4b]